MVTEDVKPPYSQNNTCNSMYSNTYKQGRNRRRHSHRRIYKQIKVTREAMTRDVT